MDAHRQLLEKARRGGIDVYFIGDSIARRWGATDYPTYLANWRENFFGWNAADFGWGADKTEHMLWRLENGELDGVNPKVIVILAGTNNVGTRPGGAARVAEITRGLAAIVAVCRQKAPAATIILTGIFPRNDNMAVMPDIVQINTNLAALSDSRRVRYMNINGRLADKDGVLFEGMMNADNLHPALRGYQVWADALKPIFTELLGPPAATDHAPPPTGDPSAAAREGRQPTFLFSMTPSFRHVAAVIVAGVAVSAAPSGQDASKPDRGEQILSASCTTCHDHRPVDTRALDEAGWTTVVKAEIGKGAKLQADDVPVLTAYLTRFHGPLPEGPGKEVVLNICTQCHDLERVRRTRLSAEGWAEVLQTMLNEGAPLTDQDFAAVLRYLARNFRPE